MADSTPKKTTTVKKSKETKEKSLHVQLVEKRNDLFMAKKSLRAGELVNPRVISSYRKDIARLLTQINTKESK